MPATDQSPETKAFLVGGGIASLAAAAFLIRDGDVPGHRITIIEESNRIGGALDASGSAEHGYVMRGGRMIERKYLCTFALFDTIPTLDQTRTVTQEIFAWNETLKTSSKSRLFSQGARHDAPHFGLSESDILTIERLVVEPEAILGNSTIASQFDAAFFKTNFWFMWCTTFAFQPWHSAVEFARYLARFAHMVAGFNRLEGIMRTFYNQFDSLVRPLVKWLEERGVVFLLDTEVTDLVGGETDGIRQITRIVTERDGMPGEIIVAAQDLVVVTLGSMTEGSSFGAMDRAPLLQDKKIGGAWALWEKIAAARPEFGHPAVFADHVAQSKWLSFTTTLRDPSLLRLIVDATGNVPGEGGLITFTESGWLASIVIPHQPHFIGQPDGVSVFWGYGLAVDAPGNFVKKPMSACSGAEILTEILGHLGITAEAERILATSTCIPCMMPFITSQFLPRKPGDRPQIIPKGWKNLALIGQFCEQEEDVVFTVEYSIRAAQTAIYSLLGLKLKPPAVYRGALNPRVLFKAFLALHDLETNSRR